jgi:two-component system, NtrC family, response regulator HydG
LFRTADGGTLFLDEIAELPILVQSKLLRVLQTGEVRPLGVDQSHRVDVRLIFATHRDLRQEVEQGRFREDLFFRLNVVLIQLPPLRERVEDIDPLIDHFLVKHAQRFSLPPCTLSSGVRVQLQSKSYRGNVRELEHQVERLVALSSGGLIEQGPDEHALVAGGEGELLGLKERVEAFERGLIISALRQCNDNRSEAARQLKVGRVTLLDKLRKYGL